MYIKEGSVWIWILMFGARWTTQLRARWTVVQLAPNGSISPLTYIHAKTWLNIYTFISSWIVYIYFPIGIESKCCMCKPISVRLCAHACLQPSLTETIHILWYDVFPTNYFQILSYKSIFWRCGSVIYAMWAYTRWRIVTVSGLRLAA